MKVLDWKIGLTKLRALDVENDVCVPLPKQDLHVDIGLRNFRVEQDQILGVTDHEVVKARIDVTSRRESCLQAKSVLFQFEEAIIKSCISSSLEDVYLLLKQSNQYRIVNFCVKSKKVVHALSLKRPPKSFFIWSSPEKQLLLVYRKKAEKLDFIKNEVDLIYESRKKLSSFGFWESQRLFYVQDGLHIRFFSTSNLLGTSLFYKRLIKAGFHGEDFLSLYWFWDP